MTAPARTARVTPSFPISLGAVRTSPWTMLALVLAAGLTVHVVLPGYLSTTVLNPMGAVIAVAAVGGIRRTTDRTAFNLLAGGVIVYALADGVAILSSAPGLHAFVTGLFLVAFTALASGLACLFAGLRRR